MAKPKDVKKAASIPDYDDDMISFLNPPLSSCKPDHAALDEDKQLVHDDEESHQDDGASPEKTTSSSCKKQEQCWKAFKWMSVGGVVYIFFLHFTSI